MGWGSSVAVSCSVGLRCGLDHALLWLWCRLAAVALIRPLAWELPYATGTALKRRRKKKIYIYICISLQQVEENTYIYIKILKKVCVYICPPSACCREIMHIEVPRLGVESELQLPGYTTATAVQDPSHICDLHHSSGKHQILNPLSEARDRTCNLMDPSWICFHCATMGTPILDLFKANTVSSVKKSRLKNDDFFQYRSFILSANSNIPLDVYVSRNIPELVKNVCLLNPSSSLLGKPPCVLPYL